MRKAVLALLAVFALIGGTLLAGEASAHGHVRVGVGVHFGAPYWGPWWWGPPYPYYPAYYYPGPVYVTPPEPKVYVERSEVEAPAAQSRASTDWWYYCEASRGYYPYVKSCPSGWQRVPPAPPPG